MSTKMQAMRSGGALGPIYPQSIDEVYRLAKMARTAGMLKAQKQGFGNAAKYESDEVVLARGTMIIMQGMELGIPPMQAVQLLAMINGRITAHSEAVPGLLLAHGLKISEAWSGTPMQDDWTCAIELTRPDGTKHVGSFSVADAKQAGLWDQSPTKTSFDKTKPNDSAWYRYPKRMLHARALGFAAKDGGADVLKGIQVREEADDMERMMRDVTPRQIDADVCDIPDVPDIPDTIAGIPEDQVTEVTDEQPDTIADIPGFLKMIRNKIAEGYTASDIYETFGEMAERLPEDARGKFEQMLESAA